MIQNGYRSGVCTKEWDINSQRDFWCFSREGSSVCLDLIQKFEEYILGRMKNEVSTEGFTREKRAKRQDWWTEEKLNRGWITEA